MDPDTCLARLIEAAVTRDPDDLLAAADDLAAWLDAGGFAPKSPVTNVRNVPSKCSECGIDYTYSPHVCGENDENTIYAALYALAVSVNRGAPAAIAAATKQAREFSTDAAQDCTIRRYVSELAHTVKRITK